MQILISYLLLGLFLGVMISYLLHPKPKLIVKYPNPNNEETTYIDNNDVCYKYRKEGVKCPIEQQTKIIDL